MNYAKLGLSLSAFVATDACLKSFFASMHWTFPAPLAGMFIIMAILAAGTGKIDAFFKKFFFENLRKFFVQLFLPLNL